MATAYELGLRYFPRLWDASRIEALVSAGRLTREEADEIIGSASGSEKLES